MGVGDGKRNQQRDQAGCENSAAQEVDLPPVGVRPNIGQAQRHNRDSQDAHRQVDVEHPAPAEPVGQPAAQCGADDRGEAEDAAEDALQLDPLLRRKDVSQHCEDSGKQHAAEEALDGSEEGQLKHVLRQAAESGGQHETDHACQQERLAAEHVAQLAGDRNHNRGADQVSGSDPGVVLEAVQLRDDARHRRPHHCLVQRRQ